MREHQARNYAEPVGPSPARHDGADAVNRNAQLFPAPSPIPQGNHSRDQLMAVTTRRVGGSPSFRTGSALLQLQRSHGNHYVQRALLQARGGAGAEEVEPAVESCIEQARGGGRPMDGTTQLQMESAFGSDFSGVRIHTDAAAHSMNEAVGAIAFTTGKDIFFRNSAYDTGNLAGKELLAHELTHVVQQNGLAVHGKLKVGEPDDQFEQEADRMGKVVSSSLSAPVQRRCACGGHAAAGGECAECTNDREAGTGTITVDSGLGERAAGKLLQLQAAGLQRRVVCPPGVSEEDGEGCYEVADEANSSQSAGADPTSAAAPGASQDDTGPVGLDPLTGQGDSEEFSMEGGCNGLSLHGLTQGNFDGGRFSVTGQAVAPGQGCSCAKGVSCLNVTGTLVTNYSTSVTISMPSVPAGLTDCQRTIVQNWLNSVLLPHEQDHKSRLLTYNGQTQTPIDVTGCKDGILGQVAAIQAAENTARKAAAKALSAQIDPFVQTIDCSPCDKDAGAPDAGPRASEDGGASSGDGGRATEGGAPTSDAGTG